MPTNDGLTMPVAAWPAAESQAMKQDLERNYLAVLRSVFDDRLDGARREERVAGSGAANHFRTPYGPGWALVGDAGYLTDPVTAQGITDAFHDAELCTQAVHETFTASRTYTEAMASYQRRRDARVLPLYEFTTQIGDLAEPPPPELVHGVLVAGDGGSKPSTATSNPASGHNRTTPSSAPPTTGSPTACTACPPRRSRRTRTSSPRSWPPSAACGSAS
jgi:2-polyprenyl-6-methoxyphenol hydroxylase-like FAD-dependent oxidoreductase